MHIGIEAHTSNNLLRVLAFGWVGASFFRGITGFGAPIAVTVPLLVGVGVQPIWAFTIPLIGRCWANVFGALAVARDGSLLVAEPADPSTTALIAAVMLWTATDWPSPGSTDAGKEYGRPFRRCCWHLSCAGPASWPWWPSCPPRPTPCPEPSLWP
ncbi:MAG: hypothetical protein HPY83_02175 [Anaerolineae bacterium]|nr:hypothetical protein [Anaerolineae bacterium]